MKENSARMDPRRRKRRILLVEDDFETRTILKDFLHGDGFEVLLASTGEDGLKIAKSDRPDLMILDVNLPGISGFEVLRELDRTPYLPVILVTARDHSTEKVIGLELGADDYVTKPYDPMELLARVRALLRRIEALSAAHDEPNLTTVGEVELDCLALEVRVAGNSCALTVTESSLLKCLMEHRWTVVTRDQILDKLWGQEMPATLRSVDVHVVSLRKKLGTLAEQKQYIQAVRGVGYRFQG